MTVRTCTVSEHSPFIALADQTMAPKIKVGVSKHVLSSRLIHSEDHGRLEVRTSEHAQKKRESLIVQGARSKTPACHVK